MKLFITNKTQFEQECLDSNEVHKNAFSQLSKSLLSGNIPVDIITKDCVFKFTQIRADIYFYEFLGTIQ